MAWIDASSVKLGCIGFSKTKSVRNSRYGSPLAKDVCKMANSKAHLIEIFNDNQSRFLMSEKVLKEVRTHIGILLGSTYYWWWIGAELKNVTWYWEHSKKPVTYWSCIGSDQYGTDLCGKDSRYPYAVVSFGNRNPYWHRSTGQGPFNSICQIDMMK